MSDFTDNLKHAGAFLKYLDEDAQTFCFRTFSDKPKQSNLARKINGPIKVCAAELQALNDQGAGVFVVINKGGQTTSDITRVRAVFADTDGAPLAPIVEALQPHIVVQSSPGNFHVYWFVDHDFPLDKFKPVQVAIATKFGTDSKVNDLPRVMRLPGFYHNKSEPYLTHPFDEKSGLPKYSFKDIIIGLKLTNPDKSTTHGASNTALPIQNAVNQLTSPQPPDPETPENIARVKSALAAINPDADRDLWRDICFAIHSTGWSCAEALARDWSKGNLI